MPTILLVTSNGVGMGHLARASVVAANLRGHATPVIVSMAAGLAEIPEMSGLRCEYIPGRDRNWMRRRKWDRYLRDRLVALADETNAKVIAFDGVVPYPGFIAAKNRRPEINFVWVRRGLWQRTPTAMMLSLQSKMMDMVIEPGDFARSYDSGPTSVRDDATLTGPVSSFSPTRALSRADARKVLGLDPDRPAVLVQLGIGEADLNSKLTAALEGLSSWKDLQVVLTKPAVDVAGNNLAPEGLDIKIVRYFPLADVLRAFDASICAAGYNSVHEQLVAGIPTLFIPNIRGTDNQEVRAQWASDNDVALTVDQSDLLAIKEQAAKLQSMELRKTLSQNCEKLPEPTGGADIAKILATLAAVPSPKIDRKRLAYILISLRFLISKGWRGAVILLLSKMAMLYRIIRPYKATVLDQESAPLFVESEDSAELRQLIRGSRRFEHILLNSSKEYRRRREEIARRAYGPH